eukprot:1377954-Amorphochlora_amoeboformis.AAC.1
MVTSQQWTYGNIWYRGAKSFLLEWSDGKWRIEIRSRISAIRYQISAIRYQISEIDAKWRTEFINRISI